MIIVLLMGMLVPFENIQDVAIDWARQEFGNHGLRKVLTYYDFSGEPNAFAFIFGDENLPNKIEKREGLRHHPYPDKFGTIIMSAHSDEVPMVQLYRGLPPWFSIENDLPDSLLGAIKVRVYYHGPMAEWIEFQSSNRTYLIDAYSNQVYEKDDIIMNVSFGPTNEHLRINAEVKRRDFFINSRRDSNYIPGVPFFRWWYNSQATVGAMIGGYWDKRNHGRLIDFYFTSVLLSKNTGMIDGAPNIQQELYRYGPVKTFVFLNGYDFIFNLYGPGGPNNPSVTWDRIVIEVNAGRPFQWSVINYFHNNQYINHTLLGIGYKVANGESLVCVNTTWYEEEEWWPLYTTQGGGSRDYVMTYEPQGGIPDNIFLSYPTDSIIMFQGLRYRIKWQSVNNIDHLNIYYHTRYENPYWHLLAGGAPDTGSWIWQVPQDSFMARIAIKGYDGSDNLLAADGQRYAFNIRTYDHSQDVTLIGHYDTPGSANDIIREDGFLYVADRWNGLLIFDISDSTLPTEIGHLPFPEANTVGYSDSFVYVGDEHDTLWVVDIKDPSNPTLLGFWPAPDIIKDLKVKGQNLLIAACYQSGIRILDITNPASPQEIGFYDTPGEACKLDLSDTLVFVADGSKGLRIVNIADSTNPVEIGAYEPGGFTVGVSTTPDRAYLAKGPDGVSILDISDPNNPKPLGSFQTPGQARSVVDISADYEILIADGGDGLRDYWVSDPQNVYEIGYLDTHGDANELTAKFTGSQGGWHLSVCLADRSDGIYLIHVFHPAVAEQAAGRLRLNKIPTIVTDHLPLSGSVPGQEELRLKIYDCLGRTVKIYRKSVKGDFSINLPLKIPAGVYFLSVEGQDLPTRKFIKIF